MGNSAFGIASAGNLLVKRNICNPSNKWATAKVSMEPFVYKSVSVGSSYGLCATDQSLLVLVNYNSSTYYTTPDLVNWTTRTLPASVSSLNLEYAGGVFMYLTSTTAYRTSSDGINWSASRTLPATVDANNARLYAFNNVFYLFVGSSSSSYYTSTDGINWTTRTAPVTGAYIAYSVVCNSKMFVKFLTSYYVSTDGINWTLTSGMSIGSTSYMSYINSTYVLVGGGMWTSSDGTTWTPAKKNGLISSTFMINGFILGYKTKYLGEDSYTDPNAYGQMEFNYYSYDLHSDLIPVHWLTVTGSSLNQQEPTAVGFVTGYSGNRVTKFGNSYIIGQVNPYGTPMIFDPSDANELVIER